MDDKEAIEKTLGGAIEAFGCLVSRYQSMVYGVALARVYDHQDALDLSQEAFLRAYTRLPMLRDRDAFAPWLCVIARRLCVDFLRGRWRKERMEQTAAQPEQFAETATDPRPGICASDTAQTLWSHIGQLDDNSREVLSLHYGQGMKVSEIAALTAAKESAVKMRLQKARAVLGDRIGDIKGAWGIAPAAASSSGIMKAINAAGPLKAGLAAGPVVSGLAGGLAVLWWSAVRDLGRWQNHAPAGMLSQSRRTMGRGILVLAAAFLLAPILAIALAPLAVHVITSASLVPQVVFVAVTVVYAVLIVTVLGTILKRETDLLSPRNKVKQFVNAGGAILVCVTASLLPGYTLGVLGVFFALQYFFVNKSDIALGAVPPGIWVTPVLKHTDAAEVDAVPAAMKQIKEWLVMLHECGLVAPPLVNDKESFTVRLRLRSSVFEKMARGAGSSSLHITSQGVVSCAIVPRDYVALAEHLGLEEFPGRQELAAALGNAFTRALRRYAEGGDKVAVADSLGLARCPIDPAKTYRFVLLKYILCIAGISLVVVSVIRHLI